jgi:hypothetical protein
MKCAHGAKRLERVKFYFYPSIKVADLAALVSNYVAVAVVNDVELKRVPLCQLAVNGGEVIFEIDVPVKEGDDVTVFLHNPLETDHVFEGRVRIDSELWVLYEIKAQ